MLGAGTILAVRLFPSRIGPREHGVPPIGILSACVLAAVTGAASAMILLRADADPTCLASESPVRIATGIGRVVTADLDKRYLTIEHNEMKSALMPAMNMMFEVKSRALMEPLRPNDKIRFTVDRSDMGIINIVVIGPAE
jgi:Cu/Ag efflux protein CusF